jgi:hypothetical protein
MTEPSFIQKLFKTLQEHVPYGEYKLAMEKALDIFGAVDAFELPPHRHASFLAYIIQQHSDKEK